MLNKAFLARPKTLYSNDPSGLYWRHRTVSSKMGSSPLISSLNSSLVNFSSFHFELEFQKKVGESYVIQKVCWIQHIQLIFVIHTLWIFYWNEKKREKIHWKIHTGVYFGRNGPFFVTLACHHFTKEIKNFLEARTNVKFVPRGSWVRIILIIEWENRERLKKRIWRELFERL